MVTSFMADKIMPLSEAVEGYDLFDKMKVQKGKNTSGDLDLLYYYLSLTMPQWYLKRKSSMVCKYVQWEFPLRKSKTVHL